MYTVPNVHYGRVVTPGVCRPPHFCAPRVCVPDTKGESAVWMFDRPKLKPMMIIAFITINSG